MAAVVIALTGEPGSGKSTAARWFAEQGAVVLDADAMVRDLWDGDELPSKARERWGETAFDDNGKIDKRAVSGVVFSDEKEYAWLCGIIYPLVFARLAAELPQNGIVVAEIPMLFEAGRPYWVNRVLFMTASGETRAARNTFRGLDEKELRRREKFFKSRDERMNASDWVICNDGSPEDLINSLRSVWVDLKALEARGGDDIEKVVRFDE